MFTCFHRIPAELKDNLIKVMENDNFSQEDYCKALDKFYKCVKKNIELCCNGYDIGYYWNSRDSMDFDFEKIPLTEENIRVSCRRRIRNFFNGQGFRYYDVWLVRDFDKYNYIPYPSYLAVCEGYDAMKKEKERD